MKNKQRFDSYDQLLGELACLPKLTHISARVSIIEGIDLARLMDAIKSLKARVVTLERINGGKSPLTFRSSASSTNECADGVNVT